MNTNHVFNFSLPDGSNIEFCSVVMSEEEFSDFVDAIVALDLIPKDVASEIRKSRRVPFLRRGTQTESLFQLCGVEVEAMGVIVRGAGQKILENLLSGKPENDYSEN